MRRERKISAALTLLVLVGAALLVSRQREAERETAESALPKLPVIALGDAGAAEVTKLQLTTPDDEDKSKDHTVVLEKLRGGWEMTSPISTPASVPKVEALLDNLKDLTVKDEIDRGTASYDALEVTGTKALHVVAWEGGREVIDLYFGKSGTRGQFVRVGGVDGVFAMANSRSEGFAGFLYTRDVRSWREPSILTFSPGDVAQIEIVNRSGLMTFVPLAGGWSGSVSPRDAQGALLSPLPEWKGFDPSKVDDFVRNYQSLDADDFGEEADRAASGVDKAEETGGVVRIRFKDGRKERTIRVGSVSHRASRWAIANNRWAIAEGGDGTLYVLAPWTADWATAEPKRFESSGDDAATHVKTAEADRPPR